MCRGSSSVLVHHPVGVDSEASTSSGAIVGFCFPGIPNSSAFVGCPNGRGASPEMIFELAKP